jgi:glycerate dehydrogenase
MKIVVLDGLPLNPGDLDWSPLHELGEVEIFDRSDAAQILERVRHAQVLVTNKCKVTSQVLEAAPALKCISVTATGFDNIDIEGARGRGVTVCNVPSYSASFTAQSTWSLILELAQRAGAHSDAVHAGDWSRCPDFSFWKHPHIELSGKTLLLVGSGNIGARAGRIGQAFGMQVLAAVLPGREGAQHSKGEFQRVPLEEGLGRADVVSLHCPANARTTGLMNAQRLKQMKPGALLVNTARGKLVDEAAVREALDSGKLGGFGADVLSVEPPPEDHPLFGAPRCILTPHIGWASIESRGRALDATVENIRKYLRGAPQNVVS